MPMHTIKTTRFAAITVHSRLPESKPIVEVPVCVMAVVRRVDHVICGEQWARAYITSGRPYSGWLITHGWISVGFLTAAATLPQPHESEGMRSV